MQGSDHDESAVLARLEAIEAALAALTGPPSTNPPSGNGLWLLGGVESEFVDSEAGGVAHGGRVRLPDGREAGWQMSHATDDLLDDTWAEHEGALKALGHRHRLELLQDLDVRHRAVERHVFEGARRRVEGARRRGRGIAGCGRAVRRPDRRRRHR